VGTKNKTTQKSTSDSTNTVAPPSWTMPGIQNLAGQVTQAASGLSALPKYTGDYVAPVDYGAANAAYGQAANMAGNLSGHVNDVIGSYDPTASYDKTGLYAAAMHPLVDQLNTNLGTIRTSAADAGAYSGSRANAILPAMAMKDFNQQSMDTLSGLSYQDYNNQQNRNLQWDQLLPGLIDEALKTSTGAGDIQTQIAQNNNQQTQQGINNNLAKNQAQYTQPFQGMDIASALLSQLSGNYGTQTGHSDGTQTTTQSTGGLGPIVSGLMGVASMAAGLPMGGGMSLGGKLLGSLFSPKPA
jgi:hypothetical protein